MTELGHLIKAFYNSILSFENLKSIIMYYLRLTPKPSFYIENDYIKQNKRINTSNKTGPIGMTIAKNKTKFLLKIIKFCRKTPYKSSVHSRSYLATYRKSFN